MATTSSLSMASASTLFVGKREADPATARPIAAIGDEATRPSRLEANLVTAVYTPIPDSIRGLFRRGKDGLAAAAGRPYFLGFSPRDLMSSRTLTNRKLISALSVFAASSRALPRWR